MVKIIIKVIFIFFMAISCSLKYNSAIIKVYNNSSSTIKYKGLLIDEQSSIESGKMIIKVVSPNKSSVYKKETDLFLLTWESFQEKVFLNITWGVSTVYESSTGFFEVKDGDIITVAIDTTNDWHFKN